MAIKALLHGGLAAGLLAASGTALAGGAAGDMYAGIGFGYTTIEVDNFEEANPSAVVGRFGYYFLNNIAVEGRAGFGLNDDTIQVSGFETDVEIDSMVGAYALAHLPIGRDASIYGLVGFTRGEATATFQTLGVSQSDDETDVSFGIGGDFGLTPTTSINVEYAQYLHDSDYDVTAASIGVMFKF